MVQFARFLFPHLAIGQDASAAADAQASVAAPYAGNYGCWSYDAFGNRLSQSMSTTPCNATPPLTSWANYNANNQFTNTSAALAGVAYDPSGDVTNDGVNQYLYDADGRICAVANTPLPNMTTMTGYLYDEAGTRVAKGSINAWSCDPAINGFQTINDYILGPGGQQVTEMGVNTTAGSNATTLVWQHTNVYAGGSLIATYDNDGLHFYLNDPLGTRRAQTDELGVVEQTCSSLPFGDGLSCTGSTTTPTEHHFTGKERDTESGNDYFGARYYASSMGRWLSPDWSAKVEPVPYAKLDNPQSLNLYSYVLDNPMTGRDLDGHVCIFGIGNTCVPTQKPAPPPPPDPAHVRPPNDHRVGPATGNSTPQTASKPKGLTIGVGISGNADVGVGVAGAEANGGYYKVASANTSGQVQVSDAASGGTVAYAGSHTAGAPDQSATSPLVAGAYAGAGLSGLIANTSTTDGLSGPFAVTQFNIPLVSVQVFNDTSGDWGMSFTIGPSTPTASVFNMTTTTRVDCEIGCN